ncbi:unnamed protein product [Ciceribacter sp. T2.26MG-112.2]|nr:unnamed protein product [Ciceribacter naphthalenivorans]
MPDHCPPALPPPQQVPSNFHESINTSLTAACGPRIEAETFRRNRPRGAPSPPDPPSPFEGRFRSHLRVSASVVRLGQGYPWAPRHERRRSALLMLRCPSKAGPRSIRPRTPPDGEGQPQSPNKIRPDATHSSPPPHTGPKLIPFRPRIHHKALWRGGAGAGFGGETQNPRFRVRGKWSPLATWGQGFLGFGRPNPCLP